MICSVYVWETWPPFCLGPPLLCSVTGLRMHNDFHDRHVQTRLIKEARLVAKWTAMTSAIAMRRLHVRVANDLLQRLHIDAGFGDVMPRIDNRVGAGHRGSVMQSILTPVDERAGAEGAVMQSIATHIDERAVTEGAVMESIATRSHVDERAGAEGAVMQRSIATYIDERAEAEAAVMDTTHIDEQGANDDGMGITELAICPLCGTKLYQLKEVLGHDCRTTWS